MPLNIPHPKFKNPKVRLLVPCGSVDCPECMEDRRQMWSIRLHEESKQHLHMSFITLTYDDEHLVYGDDHPTLVKKDLQDWFKRLRRQVEPAKLRYYAVGEYGTETKRPHYHVLLFGLDNQLINEGIIEKTWKNGHIQVGQINKDSIYYVTKYHVNRTAYPDGVEPPFALMSKRPAIGSNYIEKMRKTHDGNIDRCYYNDTGFKKTLPRYYKEKLYCEHEREQININRKKLFNIYDEEKIKEHNQNNHVSYFEYLEQKKTDKIRTFKSKVNKNNKF